MSTRILIVDNFDVYTDSLVDSLLKVPGFEVSAIARSVEEASAGLSPEPDVVILGPNISVDAAMKFAERLSKEHAGIGMILISGEMTTDLLRQGLRAGLKDIISASATPQELHEAIRAAHFAAQRLNQVAASQQGGVGISGDQGKIVTFFSTKGGVGKTVLATNTAVSLAARKKGSVCLVDFDLRFGDVGVMLGLLPKRNVFDAAQAIDRLDAEMIRGFLTPHNSGLNVLLAPPDPEHAERVPADHLPLILELLQETHDYVILDTPASFGDQVLVALDRSDEVFLIGTLDVPSTKNVKLALETLLHLAYPKEAIHVVLNRADSRVGLQPQEVQKALKHAVSASIPSDRLIPLSVNRAVPVVLESPRSPVARSITQLADLVGKRSGSAVAPLASRRAR